MVLQEFINLMEFIAGSQPCINQIIPQDVYKLNSLKNAKFGAFAWQHRQHTSDTESEYWLFSFQLFYIDRLTEDGSNELEAQAVGLDVLDNIIKSIVEITGNDIQLESPVVYQPFTFRFSQECAGDYCTVTFRVPTNCTCPEFYLS